MIHTGGLAMIIQVVRTRPLSEEELDTGTLAVAPNRLLITRRAFVSGILVIPVLGAACLLPRPAEAGRRQWIEGAKEVAELAKVVFEVGLSLKKELVELYDWIVGTTEVRNEQNTPEINSLFAELTNERNLIERQAYQVIQVPRRSLAEINVTINSGDKPGDKKLRVASRIDHVEAEVKVNA
jgi:hypothetical protein